MYFQVHQALNDVILQASGQPGQSSDPIGQSDVTMGQSGQSGVPIGQSDLSGQSSVPIGQDTKCQAMDDVLEILIRNGGQCYYFPLVQN